VIKVTPRARIREDRAGDPLDGLVNLFDLGIVLAVAFLLAALSSLNLTKALTNHSLHPVVPGAITIEPGQTVHQLNKLGAKTIGRGSPVGTVYKLPSGQLIYVTGSSTTAVPTPGTTPLQGTTPTPGLSAPASVPSIPAVGTTPPLPGTVTPPPGG
jgi:hypothetical protein